MSKLDAVQRTKTVQQLFGPEAGRFVLKAVTNVELLDKTLGLVGDKASFAGSMMRELEKKLKTGKTAWDKIKVTLNIIAITLGDAMLPAIKALAPIVVKAALAFRDFAKAHPGIVKVMAAVLALAAVVGPLLFTIGMFAAGLSFLIGPVGLVIASIAALAAVVP